MAMERWWGFPSYSNTLVKRRQWCASRSRESSSTSRFFTTPFCRPSVMDIRLWVDTAQRESVLQEGRQKGVVNS